MGTAGWGRAIALGWFCFCSGLSLASGVGIGVMGGVVCQVRTAGPLNRWQVRVAESALNGFEPLNAAVDGRTPAPL